MGEDKIAPEHESEHDEHEALKVKEEGDIRQCVLEGVWEVKMRVGCAASQLTIDVMAGRDARWLSYRLQSTMVVQDGQVGAFVYLLYLVVLWLPLKK